jgi:hypothetical protein
MREFMPNTEPSSFAATRGKQNQQATIHLNITSFALIKVAAGSTDKSGTTYGTIRGIMTHKIII